MTGGPPVIATFLSGCPSTNPIHWPSGEMNGSLGVPRPPSTSGSIWLSARTSSWLVPRYTMREPSGVIATSRSPPAVTSAVDSGRRDRRTDDGRRRRPHAPPHRAADDGPADDQRACRRKHAAPARHLSAYVMSGFRRDLPTVPPETCRLVEHEERGRRCRRRASAGPSPGSAGAAPESPPVPPRAAPSSRARPSARWRACPTMSSPSNARLPVSIS